MEDLIIILVIAVCLSLFGGPIRSAPRRKITRKEGPWPTRPQRKPYGRRTKRPPNKGPWATEPPEKSPKRSVSRITERGPWATEPPEKSPTPKPGGTIIGKAWVTDADGLKVRGHTIRLAKIDAPEHDQPAKLRDGRWIRHGAMVKSALIDSVGGKHVLVRVEDHDIYGRVVGTVTCDGKDVGEWLVLNGYAIAIRGNRYKPAEARARQERRGQWGYEIAYDPRAWRQGRKKRLR